MKSYKSLYFPTTRVNLSEIQYYEFVKHSNALIEGRLDEFGIPDFIKEKWEFIKELAKETKTKFLDLLKLFMKKEVFKLFSEFDWSLEAIFNLLKKSYKTYQNLQKIIAEWVADQGAVKWTTDKIKELDEYLEKHPKTKAIAGVAVAGLLLYIWFTMSFTGDFLDDFDLSSVFTAFKGNYKLYEFFGSPSGVKMLILFATGALTGLTFPWPGESSVKFLVAIVTTLAKYFGIGLSTSSETQVEKDADKLDEAVLKNYKSIYKESNSNLEQDIRRLFSKIVKEAQEEYDMWDESDEDTYAGGGICHLIADRITSVCQKIKNTSVTTFTYSDVQHVVTVVGRITSVKNPEEDEEPYDKECCIVDIPYYFYEKGGGYTWTKIPNVTFKPSMIKVDLAEYDEFFTEDGDPIDY